MDSSAGMYASSYYSSSHVMNSGMRCTSSTVYGSDLAVRKTVSRVVRAIYGYCTAVTSAISERNSRLMSRTTRYTTSVAGSRITGSRAGTDVEHREAVGSVRLYLAARTVIKSIYRSRHGEN